MMQNYTRTKKSETNDIVQLKVKR